MAAAEEARILIAMDGSKYAEYAFEWYLAQLHKPSDFVILLNCFEIHSLTTVPMGVGAAELIARTIEEENVHAKHLLEKLTNKMKESNLHGKVKQITGPPRTEILKVAEEEKCTLIITGSRGMGKVKRTFLGSVSDHIIHHAHVPVLVCRHKDDHKELEHHPVAPKAQDVHL